MSTPPRFFQQGFYYHVYNRGNRKQNIFLQANDYERFLTRIEEYSKKFGITLLCYCLMKNHFHFLVRQDTNVPISVFMLRLATSYAKYFNIKYEEVGSLFQDRFKAKVIEADDYLLHLSRYIHRNPFEILTPGVGLDEFRWSSYSDYLKGIRSTLVDPSYILNYFSKTNKEKDYKSFVEYEKMNKEEAFFNFNPWG